MTALSQRIELHQAQKLSPRLQQAVRLLQMSSLDFMQEVHAMIDSNPFLEGTEADAPHESHDPEREPWLADGRGAGAPRVATDGGDLESLGSVAVSVTLVEHLHRQLNMITLPLRDAPEGLEIAALGGHAGRARARTAGVGEPGVAFGVGGRLGLVAFEERVRIDHRVDLLHEVERRHLQQPDRLLQSW